MPFSTALVSPIKSIGLICGEDPETWFLYRRAIDEQMQDRFGRRFRPRLMGNDMHATALELAMQREDWKEVQRLGILAAQQCVAGGAEGLILCNSTLHIAAGAITAAVGVPLFHIVDGTLNNLVYTGVKRIGLLGTRFANEQRVWQGRCHSRGVEATVPASAAMDRITQIIHQELGRGVITDESRREVFRIAADFQRQGVTMIVTAAPELQLVLNQENTPLPLIHAMVLQVANAITWATGMTLPILPTPPCEAVV